VWADRIGFLPLPHALEFTGGRLKPLPEHAELLELVVESTNQDGFLYPPLELSFRDHIALSRAEDAKAMAAKMPRRPAPVFRLPASHSVELDEATTDEPRLGDAGFIVQLLATLYGYRLQFHDWWLDSRVPITKSTVNVGVYPAQASQLLDSAYRVWRERSQREQRALTNIAYMHSRAGCYEAYWERFTIEYMVLDAAYAYSATGGAVTACKHAERMGRLCDAYGLLRDEAAIEGIVRLRNELFHEALWDGDLPGYAPAEDARVFAKQLRCFNHRLICAMVGWTGAYVGTPWTFWRAPFLFE